MFIGTNKVNCLMYADDVILLSTSREGLQNCLNSLYAYAEKWKLKVNTEKKLKKLHLMEGATYKG